jgi:hypothetical protein
MPCESLKGYACGPSPSFKKPPQQGMQSSTAKKISTASKLQPSPLFRFPLEVRRLIYSFVIGKHETAVHQKNGPCESQSKGPYRKTIELVNRTRSGATQTAEQKQNFRTRPSRLAIAGTCRQIYHEVAKIWYGDVRFYFASMPCTMLFLEEIGEWNREAIRFVGFKACWGPQDKLNQEILRSARIHLPNLKVPS